MLKIFKVLVLNYLIIFFFGGTVWISVGYIFHIISIDNLALQSFFRIPPEQNNSIKTGDWLSLLPRATRLFPEWAVSQAFFLTLLLRGKILGSHKLEETKRGRRLLAYINRALSLN